MDIKYFPSYFRRAVDYLKPEPYQDEDTSVKVLFKVGEEILCPVALVCKDLELLSWDYDHTSERDFQQCLHLLSLENDLDAVSFNTMTVFFYEKPIVEQVFDIIEDLLGVTREFWAPPSLQDLIEPSAGGIGQVIKITPSNGEWTWVDNTTRPWGINVPPNTWGGTAGTSLTPQQWYDWSTGVLSNSTPTLLADE
jgi:hypothetical protein